MGKDWAKRLTAKTDPRVARAAGGHRGLHYRRRGVDPTLSIVWSPDLACALGLIATDGCLSRDGRHIAFVTKDEELMRTWLASIGRSRLRYARGRSATGTAVFRIQVSHAALYRWLVARGITPRKSLTLGAIDVPDEHLAHFVRGLFDGDRSIYVRLQRPTLRRYPNYRYVRLWTYFSTASWSHVRWLHGRLRGWLGITGWIEERERLSGNMLYRLRFGKGDSIVLLRAIYADPSWPALNRKRQTWSTYERETFGAEGGT